MSWSTDMSPTTIFYCAAAAREQHVASGAVGGGVPGVVGGWDWLGGLYRVPTQTIPGPHILVYSRPEALPTAK